MRRDRMAIRTESMMERSTAGRDTASVQLKATTSSMLIVDTSRPTAIRTITRTHTVSLTRAGMHRALTAESTSAASQPGQQGRSHAVTHGFFICAGSELTGSSVRTKQLYWEYRCGILP